MPPVSCSAFRMLLRAITGATHGRNFGHLVGRPAVHRHVCQIPVRLDREILSQYVTACAECRDGYLRNLPSRDRFVQDRYPSGPKPTETRLMSDRTNAAMTVQRREAASNQHLQMCSEYCADRLLLVSKLKRSIY